MAIDPNIRKKANDIRNKVYGREVRESLASGLEEMSSDVVENEGRQSVVEVRQDSVESQWQAVSDEMTDKDVISAPEIIAARDGEANLKARLDKEKNEVTAQLAQIAINVKQLPLPLVSAKGDGTTDDTQAIQNAFDYVATLAGGTVYIPTGHYIVSDEMKIKSDDVTVLGTGYSTHIDAQSDFSVLFSEGFDNLKFSGLRITGSRTDGGYTGYGHGIRVENANNILIENNFIEEIDGKAIHLAGFNQHNLNLEQGVYDAWVFNNFIDWCGDGVMVINDGRRVQVDRNIIKRCTNIGIYIDDSHRVDGTETPRASTEINVTNNIVTEMLGTTGINFAGTQYSVARGNYVSFGGKDMAKNINGISLQTVQNHVETKHNIIEGNTIVKNSNIGVDLIGASNNIIRDNNIVDSGFNRTSGDTESINLRSIVIKDVLFGSDNNIIENNKLQSISAESKVGHQIRIRDENNSRNIVRFNKIDGGIYDVTDNGTNTIIEENIFNGVLRTKLFENGSSSNPSIAFESEPKTGFFKAPTAGQINYTANGRNIFALGPTSTLYDGVDFNFSLEEGNRIGTSPKQKIGFWGATPKTRPTGYSNPAGSPEEAVTLLNKLRIDLLNIGIIETGR